MFVSDRFIFLHIPKTGGTFVDRLIRRHLGAAQVGSRHSSYSTVPEHWSHLPGFYIVRSPWDWYVSWYHHQIETGGRKARSAGKIAMWHELMLAGRAGFREAVERACSGEHEHPLAGMMRAEGVDLYSAYVKSIAGPVLERSDFEALRFERLREDLLRFLEAHAEVTAELRAAILETPPQRTSVHRHYSEYYDPELRRLVGEKTAWLRQRFGYALDERAAASAEA